MLSEQHVCCCRYHYSFNTGLQSQSVLYSQTSLESKDTVLLDPNKLSEDGTVSAHTHPSCNSYSYLCSSTLLLVAVMSSLMMPDHIDLFARHRNLNCYTFDPTPASDTFVTAHACSTTTRISCTHRWFALPPSSEQDSQLAPAKRIHHPSANSKHSLACMHWARARPSGSSSWVRIVLSVFEMTTNAHKCTNCEIKM